MINLKCCMFEKKRKALSVLVKKTGDRIGIDLLYFLRNGFWVTLRQGVGSVMGLLLMIVFARLATQEVFGQYQFILSILAVVSIFSIPGLNTSIIRSAAKGYDGDYPEAVRTSFFWSLLGIPALLVIGGYYFVYQNYLVGISLMVASVFFPFLYASNTWDYFLQGKGRFDIAAKFSSIQSIINMVGTVGILFFYRNNLVLIIISYLLFSTFFNVYYYLKSIRFIENEKRDKDMVRYGWFLTKINVLGMISGNMDKLLIGIFLGPAQLAVYSVGIIFAKQIQNISKNFLWILVPKQIQQNVVSNWNYIKIFSLSAIVTVVFLFSFRFIIPFFFTSTYVDSVSLSALSMVFYPVFVVSVLYRNQLTFNKKEGVLLRESLISPFIMAFFTIIFLPLFGIEGLAFLFGFQYVIGLSVLFVLNKVPIFLSQKQ